MGMTYIGLAAYFLIGVVIGSAALAPLVPTAHRLRLVLLWAVFVVCWPSVLVVCAVYQTTACRVWVDRFVYGERRS